MLSGFNTGEWKKSKYEPGSSYQTLQVNESWCPVILKYFLNLPYFGRSHYIQLFRRSTKFVLSFMVNLSSRYYFKWKSEFMISKDLSNDTNFTVQFRLNRLVMFPPINLRNCSLVILFHKSSMCNHVSVSCFLSEQYSCHHLSWKFSSSG